MISRMNGKPLIEGSRCGVLDVGASYCARHLREVPKLTRDEVRKLGGQFPTVAARIPSKPAKEPVKSGAKERKPKVEGRGSYRFVGDIERAKIIAPYEAKTPVHRIASEVLRTAPCVRNVLKLAGVYRNDPRYGATRGKIIAAWHSGKSIAECTRLASTVESYTRTVLVEAGILQRRKAAA